MHPDVTYRACNMRCASHADTSYAQKDNVNKDSVQKGNADGSYTKKGNADRIEES